MEPAPHHHTGAVSAQPTEARAQMIRDEAIQSIQTHETDQEDRSMRVIEYAIALVAFAVAAVLALVR